MGAFFRKDVPILAPFFQLINRTGITRPKMTGGVVRETAVAVFDPSGNSGHRSVGAHGLGVFIPTKAIITEVRIDIPTTFADGASDNATIALKVESANDIVSAIAISDASNVWDAGMHGAKPGNFALDGNSLTQIAMAAARAASWIKTTAEREITATVAVHALTAGKANIYVDYVISD